MAAGPLITLTTDFGALDPYVASMKGVIRTLCPGAVIDDLSHEIAPQDLIHAAIFIASAASCYPPGTVHIVVVDPGVGSERRPLAVRAGGQTFLCPDNGLLSLYFREHPVEQARIVENPAFMRAAVSATFHGRDIFAPAAALIAAGRDFAAVGPVAEDLATLELPEVVSEEGGRLQGQVIHVDHFGNCITNIEHEMLAEATVYRVHVAATAIPRIYNTYAAAPYDQPIALFGSSGRLEIALRDGNASDTLQLGPGDPVTLYPA